MAEHENPACGGAGARAWRLAGQVIRRWFPASLLVKYSIFARRFRHSAATVRPRRSTASLSSVGDSQRTKRLSKRSMAGPRLCKNRSICDNFSFLLTARVC